MNNELISNRNFGVELEAHPTLEAEQIINLIKSNSQRDVIFTSWEQTQNNSYWHLKTDSTCGGAEKNGWEVVSYKGSGPFDIQHIAEIAGLLGSCGLSCGSDCGFHVHVDLSDFDTNQAAILLARWIKIEKLMLESVPRFRSFNRHCRALRGRISPKNKRYEPDFFWDKYKPVNFSLHGNRDKRVTMNLVNYATCISYENGLIAKNSYCNSTRKTVEFRFSEGTFCENDVKNWILLFVRFVDVSRKAEMPLNLLSVRKIKDFFEILGIYDEMVDVKYWLCERVAKNAFSKRWKKIFQKNLLSFKV